MPKRTSHSQKWNAVQKSLRAAADPALIAFYQTAAPTGGTILGIRVPAIRVMVKDYARDAKGLAALDAVAFADIAFRSACREEMLFATFLLARFKRTLEPAHWKSLNRWIDGIDNWEVCDQLAMNVAGEMIARAPEPQQKTYLRDLEKWTRSPNSWRRRFALAATTSLNQKGRHNAVATLRICERLLADPDKSVQKALGWALREACKSDAPAVFTLLTHHAARMSPALLRESAAKLPAAQRAALASAAKAR